MQDTDVTVGSGAPGSPNESSQAQDTRTRIAVLGETSSSLLLAEVTEIKNPPQGRPWRSSG